MRAFPTVQIHFQLDWHAFYRRMFAESRIEPTTCQCRVQHLKHVECISVTCPLMPHVLIFVIKYIFKKKERKNWQTTLPGLLTKKRISSPFPQNHSSFRRIHFYQVSMYIVILCDEGVLGLWSLTYGAIPYIVFTMKTMPKAFRCDDTRLCGAFMTQFAMTFIGLSFIFLMVPKIAFCFSVVLMLPPTGSSFKTLIHDY